MRRILVTGAGGVSGVNFVRALRATPERLYIAGTDYNPYHINFPDLDASYRTPKHSDASFFEIVHGIVEKETIDFLHPNPEVEAYVIALNRDKVKAKLFLPSVKAIEASRDKYLTAKILSESGLAPKTKLLEGVDDVDEAFASMGSPLWVRIKEGAGGLGGLRCNDAEEAKSWISAWEKLKGRRISDFIVQEYLPNRDLAWDSLWMDGELVTSFARERLEYAFKHLTFSGIAGTPSVTRTVHDARINEVASKAVKLMDVKPHGIYCVDLREDEGEHPKVTEVGAKVHTTLGLWGYSAVKALNLPWYANIPYLYVYLAFSKEKPEMPKFDLYPEGYYLLRHIDSGAVLWREDGWKERLL